MLKIAKKKPSVPIKAGPSKAREIVDRIKQQINAKYKKTVITTLGDAHGARIHKFSTGSVALDIATRGGWVTNKCFTIWGKRSVAKTAIATIAGINHVRGIGLWPPYDDFRAGLTRIAVVLDLEDSFDPRWAQVLGADPDLFLLAKASSGESAFEVICDLVDMQDVSVHLIIDSVKAIVASSDIELGQDKSVQPGTHARVINRGLRKLWPRLQQDLEQDSPRHNVMFLNQATMKIGMVFGNPETLGGGMMFEHVQAQIVRLNRKETIKSVTADKKSENMGFTVTFDVEKDKTGGAEGSRGEFTFYRQRCPQLGLPAGSIDNAADIVRPALDYGVLKKNGNRISFGKTELAFKKSFDEAAARLRKDRKLYSAIHTELFKLIGQECDSLIKERRAYDSGRSDWGIIKSGDDEMGTLVRSVELGDEGDVKPVAQKRLLNLDILNDIDGEDEEDDK